MSYWTHGDEAEMDAAVAREKTAKQHEAEKDAIIRRLRREKAELRRVLNKTLARYITYGSRGYPRPEHVQEAQDALTPKRPKQRKR